MTETENCLDRQIYTNTYSLLCLQCNVNEFTLHMQCSVLLDVMEYKTVLSFPCKA